MKSNAKCVKCGSTEIYTNEGQSKAGDRVVIPVSSWGRLFVSTYMCADCGYFEEYIENEHLQDPKKIAKLKENWKKL